MGLSRRGCPSLKRGGCPGLRRGGCPGLSRGGCLLQLGLDPCRTLLAKCRPANSQLSASPTVPRTSPSRLVQCHQAKGTGKPWVTLAGPGSPQSDWLPSVSRPEAQPSLSLLEGEATRGWCLSGDRPTRSGAAGAGRSGTVLRCTAFCPAGLTFNACGELGILFNRLCDLRSLHPRAWLRRAASRCRKLSRSLHGCPLPRPRVVSRLCLSSVMVSARPLKTGPGWAGEMGETQARAILSNPSFQGRAGAMRWGHWTSLVLRTGGVPPAPRRSGRCAGLVQIPLRACRLAD